MTQYMRPNSDVTTGQLSWLRSTGSYCYTCIDETSYDDADYMYTEMRNCEEILGLSTPADTPAPGGGTLRFRAKASGSSKSLTPSILQGTTVIKAGSAVTLGTSYVEYTLVLSEAEMANITDWSAVRVRFVSGNDSSTTLYVSWAQFEVPDPAPAAGLEMGMMF